MAVERTYYTIDPEEADLHEMQGSSCKRKSKIYVSGERFSC